MQGCLTIHVIPPLSRSLFSLKGVSSWTFLGLELYGVPAHVGAKNLANLNVS